MIFVRGSHEDQVWLDTLKRQSDATESPFPIDVYRRISCLKTGLPHTLLSGAESAVVLDIGWIGPPFGEPEDQRPKYLQDYEREQLYDLGKVLIDVLLTHDVPSHGAGIEPRPGMEEVRLILDAYLPAYHFYGHTEEPFQERLDRNGITISCRMADLSWAHGRQGRLPPGAMGMLRWRDRTDHAFPDRGRAVVGCPSRVEPADAHAGGCTCRCKAHQANSQRSEGGLGRLEH